MSKDGNTRQEVPHDEKWKLAAKRAQRTATWAKTMTKKLISQSNGDQPRWHVINFIGSNKSESRGIVDLLAIRRNHQNLILPLKRGDLFEIILLQVKGGSAKWPTQTDIHRLEMVQSKYQASAVILSEWKKGKQPNLYRLSSSTWIALNNAEEVFCPKKDTTPKKKTPKRSAGKMTAEISSDTTVTLTPTSASASKMSPAQKAWATRKRST